MLERESHKRIWENFINGDEAALLELYQQHYLALMNYGQLLVADKELVNDCLMDMLLDFWKKRASLPSVQNVRSYLMTSFRRLILHQLRNDKRREGSHEASQHSSDDFQRSYEDYIVNIQSDKGLKDKITKAMAKLTDRQIELVRLKFFEDFDYDEIADQCGITKRTAYNIIYDALKILKAELHSDHNSSFLSGFSVLYALLLLKFILKK